MPEYITKEQAELIVESALREYIRTGAVETAFEELYSLPAADVAPVVHAQWRYVGSNWECSNCLFPVYSKSKYYHYCPQCGARMGGEDK